MTGLGEVVVNQTTSYETGDAAFAVDKNGVIVLWNQAAEKALAIKLVQFPEVLDAVTADCTPNLLCNYLFELAGLFMSFYEACPVIKADANVRTSRLLLCKVTAATLKKGLDLLGIGTVERM